MHSWISRFACHLGHLIPGSQIQQMSSELGFWSFIIFECSENIWLSYFKINWKKSIQTIFMSLMLLCISLYLCACTSIHLFFCVCCINVCVQILQFIRTFKAEIPVRNQGRSVSCIHRSHNQLALYTCFLDILVKNENWIAGDQLEGFITFHIWMPICFWGVLLLVEYLCLLELNLLFDVEAQPFSSRYTNLQCAYWDKAEYQPINYTPHRFTTVFSQNSTHPFIFTYYSHEPRHLILSTF